jgi:hypothetical protein
MTPGAIQFTVIFSLASCSAAALVSPNSAVLLTEYAPKSCKTTGKLLKSQCQLAHFKRMKPPDGRDEDNPAVRLLAQQR